jgi:hypothetical protein
LETDRKKAFLRPARKRKPEDETAPLKRATVGILDAKPHCISRAAARILGSGVGSCGTTTINDQMLAKHPRPKSGETWTPHERPADDFDETILTILTELMDRFDPYVGVGPRGVHAHYITCLSRARTNGLATEEGAGMQPFRKLGELVLGSACSWFSRELAANMLTSLMKNATGNDARPASAKDCDDAVWIKSMHRAVVKSVSDTVCPQQLEIGVELKNVAARIYFEERLASGRGGALAQTIHLITRVMSRQRENGQRSKSRMQPSSPARLISKPGFTQKNNFDDSRRSELNATQIFSPGLRRAGLE